MKRNRRDFRLRQEHVLYMVKKTQIEMMRDRGFDIEKVTSDETDSNINEDNLFDYTEKEFINFYKNVIKGNDEFTMRTLMSGIYTHKKTGFKTLVYYAEPVETKNVNTSNIIDFVNKLRYNIADNYILITNKDIGSPAKDLIKFKNIKVETFKDEDLIVNPISQAPLHEAMSKEEQELMLKNNNYNPDDLPKILPSDKIVRYYGFSVGQVIKIYRIESFERSMVRTLLTYRIIHDLSDNMSSNTLNDMSEDL